MLRYRQNRYNHLAIRLYWRYSQISKSSSIDVAITSQLLGRLKQV